MPVRIVSAGGGGITLSAASTGSEFTATLPANTGTVVTTASTAAVAPAMLTQPMTLATAQASTSGTAIDFTGIPSWARRITVMLNGVSTNGTSPLIARVGAGTIQTTGYLSTSILGFNSVVGSNSTVGALISGTVAAADLFSGTIIFSNVSANAWVFTSMAKRGAGDMTWGAGDVTLSGVLDRVRITTVGGTDTFDAGSINILYEG